MHRKQQFRALIPNARKLALVKNGPADSTLYVYGVIGDDGWGDGISALDFAKQVAQAEGTLHVRINSPGGDVFEGRAMAQALREYKGEVIAHVDGIAASAATFLTTAAKNVVMAKGSMLMIHNAWTYVGGNAEDLLQSAALLEKIDGQLAKDYATRTGGTPEQAKAWMDAETWFTEEEAIDAKLADSVATDENGASARAAWDLTAYAKAPASTAKPGQTELIDLTNLDSTETVIVAEKFTYNELNYAHAKRRAALFS